MTSSTKSDTSDLDFEFGDPPPLPEVLQPPLLDHRETRAYADFLDRLALDFDADTQADMVYGLWPELQQPQQVELFSPPSLAPQTVQSPLTVEDRANILRAAHRSQGLAWGSDPRFSQHGFLASGAPVSGAPVSGTPASERAVARKPVQDEDASPSRREDDDHRASEILRQMSTERLKHTLTDPIDTVLLKRPRETSKSDRSDKSESDSPDKKTDTDKNERDLLSDAQRRKNHISSEKKRRDVIKQGFEELCSLVPVLKAGGFSKSTVLNHVVVFLKELKDKNGKLQELLQSLERD